MSINIKYPEQQQVSNFAYYNDNRLRLVNNFTQAVTNWAYKIPSYEFTMETHWKKKINEYFNSKFYRSLKLLELIQTNVYIDELSSTVTIELVGAHNSLIYIIQNKPE